MSPLASHVFEITAPVPPAEVWRVITGGGCFLYGMELVSDWSPGSSVEARAGGTNGDEPARRLRGEVVAAFPPHRLSLVFEQEGADGGSATHLTWEIGPAGSVRLTVDEIDGDCVAEAVSVWSPVMAALAAALCAGGGGAAG